MAITSALVLLAVIWFLVLFLVLPFRLVTQDEAGEVAPGTPRSAPTNPQIRRKAKIVTLSALPLWVLACAIIISGAITISDIDMFHRFGPDSGAMTAAKP